MNYRNELQEQTPNLGGVYVLVISLRCPTSIRIGQKRSFFLKEGIYLYVGSALGRGASSLQRRIRRHLSREKKPFWHIDRLLNMAEASIISIIFSTTSKRMECILNRAIHKGFNKPLIIEGFGSSDCTSRCRGHLCRIDSVKLNDMLTRIKDLFHKEGLHPRRLNLDSSIYV